MRDFFFQRVMFPISDGQGRLIAFGARALEADAKPKYINTGETVLFSKGQLLYNFATARPAALKSGAILVRVFGSAHVHPGCLSSHCI